MFKKNRSDYNTVVWDTPRVVENVHGLVVSCNTAILRTWQMRCVNMKWHQLVFSIVEDTEQAPFCLRKERRTMWNQGPLCSHIPSSTLLKMGLSTKDNLHCVKPTYQLFSKLYSIKADTRQADNPRHQRPQEQSLEHPCWTFWLVIQIDKKEFKTKSSIKYSRKMSSGRNITGRCVIDSKEIQNSDIQLQNSARRKTSFIDCDCVQPPQCQTSHVFIYLSYK